MNTIIVLAGWGSRGVSSTRLLSNWSRWSLISPKWAKPTMVPVCLSNTRSSRTCISSSKRRMHFSHSGQDPTLAASIHQHSVHCIWKTCVSLHIVSIVSECPLRRKLQTTRAPQGLICTTGSEHRQITELTLCACALWMRINATYLCLRYRHQRIIRGCQCMVRASFWEAASSCCS